MHDTESEAVAEAARGPGAAAFRLRASLTLPGTIEEVLSPTHPLVVNLGSAPVDEEFVMVPAARGSATAELSLPTMPTAEISVVGTVQGSNILMRKPYSKMLRNCLKHITTLHHSDSGDLGCRNGSEF